MPPIVFLINILTVVPEFTNLLHIISPAPLQILFIICIVRILWIVYLYCSFLFKDICTEFT